MPREGDAFLTPELDERVARQREPMSRPTQRLFDGFGWFWHVLTRFSTVWVSQAAAKQRAGRAGRTRPGVCWRLCRQDFFEKELPKHTPLAHCGVFHKYSYVAGNTLIYLYDVY